MSATVTLSLVVWVLEVTLCHIVTISYGINNAQRHQWLCWRRSLAILYLIQRKRAADLSRPPSCVQTPPFTVDGQTKTKGLWKYPRRIIHVSVPFQWLTAALKAFSSTVARTPPQYPCCPKGATNTSTITIAFFH